MEIADLTIAEEIDPDGELELSINDNKAWLKVREIEEVRDHLNHILYLNWLENKIVITKEELIKRFKLELDKGISFDNFDLGEDIGFWYNSIPAPSWDTLKEGSFTEEFYFERLNDTISIDAYRYPFNGTVYNKETIR